LISYTGPNVWEQSSSVVFAGSSVPGGILDLLRGSVMKRSADDAIILEDATLHPAFCYLIP
jgi:hypothetical protein